MGVNDLVRIWRQEAQEGAPGGIGACAVDMEEVARTAWHPVSEPPTEGDQDGRVLTLDYTGCVSTEYWDEIGCDPDIRYWAAIHDVVLMPPED